MLAAIERLDLKKVNYLIKAKIDSNSTRCKNPISAMASMEYHSMRKSLRKEFYAIARFLLDQNMDPDSREKVSRRTLLHQAVYFGNKGFTRSLLKRGANPHRLLVDFSALDWSKSKNQKILIRAEKKYSSDTLLYKNKKNKTTPWLKNAFDLEGKKPWLQAMVDKVTLENNKKSALILQQVQDERGENCFS